MIPGSRFINGKTCIILDEIQECKEARTALKSFHIDGRFDVIATGSLLGVKGYGKSKTKKEEEGQDSVPVGYESVVDMYPLDFEEFLWANGITDSGHCANGLEKGGTRRICKSLKDNGLYLSPFSVNLSEVRLYRLK